MTQTKKIPMHNKKYGKRALKLPLIASFDIETEGLGGKYIMGAVVTSDGVRELLPTLPSVFQFIVDHPQYRYIAHNAAGYEFAYLMPLFYRYFDKEECGIETTMQGDTRIVQIRIYPDRGDRKHFIDIRDTYCLFASSLDDVSKGFCPDLPKLKGNINFEKETFDPGNELHMEYLWRDCDTLFLAYVRLHASLVESFNSPMGVTAGATALRAFYASIPPKYVYYRLKPDVEQFMRQAYYGGIVLPGHKVGNWGEVGSIDINGAYAYQMRKHLFPVGSPVQTLTYRPGKIGYYHVLVTVPYDIYDKYGFNPVPMRTKTGLCYPSGTFDTFITSIEIEFAVKLGCTFQVLRGYYFQRCEYVFKGFIDKCQELELEDKGKRKPTIKIIRNALYGKFGTKPTHKKLVFSKQTLTTTNGYEAVIDLSRKATPIPYLYMKDEESESDYILPHWAGLITAYERVYLMGFILKCYQAGAKNVYCDTDSIKCDLKVLMHLVEQGEIPIGILYGQFKLEQMCSEFILLGPKCFAGVTTEVQTDKNGDIVYDGDAPVMKKIFKAKGVATRALSLKVYTDALKGIRKTNDFNSVESPLTLLKTGAMITPKIRKRKITDMRNSQSWVIDKDGGIHPLTMSMTYDQILQRMELT